MADLPPSARRLDSWKSIADYLHRDVATARRWEKTVGLPVRRVPGGTGSSVFAFTSEIDAWLTARESGSPTPRKETLTPHRQWRWLPTAAAVLVIPIAWAMVMRPSPVKPGELRLDVTTAGAVAFDARGRERWRYTFPPAYKIAFPEPAWRIEDAPPAVYLATAAISPRSDGPTESGTLTWLDLDGRLQRTFAFDDRVVSHGRTLGPPWGLTAFAVQGAGHARRIAVAAHHYVWNPGLVTVLDDQWKRRGTFVNDGWIEDVRWIAPDRLLISGFSNDQDGGMVALLDASALEQPRGDTPVTPLRIAIMPRTELNRATASPFNDVVLQLQSDRIVARTIEVPSTGAEAVDALYEFTPSLDVIGAYYSDRYREMYRALDAQGKIDHSHGRPVDPRGPASIRMWAPATGWTTVAVGTTRDAEP